MFKKKTTAEPTLLDQAIADAYSELAGFSCDEDGYAKIVAQITKMEMLRKDLESGRKISPDTLATIFANLAGIVMILGHERAHVITTKAIGFVAKLR